jgi:DtxR family Mn-dependent transcriptional regulator
VASSTVEDYVKHIYLLQQGLDRRDPVAPGRIASAVGVVPGTATTMLKSLADAGLVRYELRSGVRLTVAGEKLALRILRRHRLTELFLVRVLGMDWGDVHDEAERLEHALSDKLIDRIDELLGRPGFDPHGDPIPDARGKLPPRTLTPLSEANAGDRLTVARITDQDRAFLDYATARGLTPGVALEVVDVDPAGGVVSVQRADAPVLTLAQSIADKVLVTSREPS